MKSTFDKLQFEKKYIKKLVNEMISFLSINK